MLHALRYINNIEINFVACSSLWPFVNLGIGIGIGIGIAIGLKLILQTPLLPVS